MRHKKAKWLRNIAKTEPGTPDIKYIEQTFHHVYTGKDRQGNKTFMEVTNPIKLDKCKKLTYKELKNDYKTNG